MDFELEWFLVFIGTTILISIVAEKVCTPADKPCHKNKNKAKQIKTKQNKTKHQTKPNQTKPNQTKPNQTKPKQTKPNQTKPNQNKTKQNKTKQNKTKQNKTFVLLPEVDECPPCSIYLPI
jgi:flagellum-specific peptidoglycan hydrolase FlgJ